MQMYVFAYKLTARTCKCMCSHIHLLFVHANAHVFTYIVTVSCVMYTLTVSKYSRPVAPFQLISFPPLPALSRECRRRWNKRPNSLVILTLWAYIHSRKFLLHYTHYTLIRVCISMKMPLKSWNKSCGVVGLLTTTVLPDEVILGTAIYFDGLYRSLNMHMKSVLILRPRVYCHANEMPNAVSYHAVTPCVCLEHCECMKSVPLLRPGVTVVQTTCKLRFASNIESHPRRTYSVKVGSL